MTNDEICEVLEWMITDLQRWLTVPAPEIVRKKHAQITRTKLECLTALRDRLALADKLADECERLLVVPDNVRPALEAYREVE